MKFKSLKYKVLFWFIGITSILLFLFSFLLYYFLEESLNLKIQTNLYHNAVYVHEKMLKSNQIDLSKINDYEVAIVYNNHITKTTTHFTLKNINHYLQSDEIFFVKEIDEYNVNAIYILKFTKPYKGAIVIYKKGLSNKAEDLEDILLFLNPILLVLLLLIGNRLIDKILNPIKNLTQSAKNISVDNFSHTLEIPTSNNEIAQLIKTFNEMIIRLQNQVDIIENFNNDLAHELKTPLTVMQGELELALKKQRDEKYYKETIQKVLEKTYEIKELTQTLLLLTKYSKHNIKDTFEKCYLDSILLTICENYKQQLEKKNITLKFDKFESISFMANKTLIISIFSNLIDNAIKYSTSNTTITISLYKQNTKIHYIIKDEGISIPTAEINKVTNRFYRIDKSRNKSIKGFGLGLSIVKNSVELHNGILHITSQKNIGTTIEIIF